MTQTLPQARRRTGGPSPKAPAGSPRARLKRRWPRRTLITANGVVLVVPGRHGVGLRVRPATRSAPSSPTRASNLTPPGCTPAGADPLNQPCVCGGRRPQAGEHPAHRQRDPPGPDAPAAAPVRLVAHLLRDAGRHHDGPAPGPGPPYGVDTVDPARPVLADAGEQPGWLVPENGRRPQRRYRRAGQPRHRDPGRSSASRSTISSSSISTVL